MLEIDGVFKRLGHTVAVRDCSLQIAAGERVAISGPNGAGKSTLLRIVAGVIAPDRGSVRWKGSELRGKGRRDVGYVPEAADPPGHLTVGELLHVIAATKSCKPCSRELVERLEIEELLGARIFEISLGQRRRACLAAALVGDPELLLLDEPTNGLDAAAIAMLAELLVEDAERAVLLVTHDEEFAGQVGTRRVTMRDGGVEG
ncbi:MAG: ATP-binding cassette domain-containing protein [Myxococcales bacterium]|nr:ATP-binding cassette domain-containing protein [Myxococcales bacterium]